MTYCGRRSRMGGPTDGAEEQIDAPPRRGGGDGTAMEDEEEKEEETGWRRAEIRVALKDEKDVMRLFIYFSTTPHLIVFLKSQAVPQYLPHLVPHPRPPPPPLPAASSFQKVEIFPIAFLPWPAPSLAVSTMISPHRQRLGP